MGKHLLFLVFIAACLGYFAYDAASAYSLKDTLTGKSASSGAEASPAIDLPENPTPGQIDAVVARLSDDQVRRLLITELQKTASAPRGPALPAEKNAAGVTLFEDMESTTHIAHKRIRTMAANLNHMPMDITRAIDRLSEKKRVLWSTAIDYCHCHHICCRGGSRKGFQAHNRRFPKADHFGPGNGRPAEILECHTENTP